jgi:hypothetical protein
MLAALLMAPRLLAPVVAAVLLASSAQAFDAQTLAGAWAGTWKNKKFKGVGGPFSIVITATDANTITIDASGADFGCGPLGSPVTLVKGTDWTDAGAGPTTFSTITLSYDGTTRKLVGTGSNCHGTWSAKGRVNKALTRFKGKSVTRVPGPARSVIRATRQP